MSSPALNASKSVCGEKIAEHVVLLIRTMKSYPLIKKEMSS